MIRTQGHQPSPRRNAADFQVGKSKTDKGVRAFNFNGGSETGNLRGLLSGIEGIADWSHPLLIDQTLIQTVRAYFRFRRPECRIFSIAVTMEVCSALEAVLG
jgi:hypothetical protein